MREEEVFQLKGNVGFRADNANSPRKTEFPSNFQTSNNQSSDILRQPFKWTCGIRNTNVFMMNCDQFRRLYYMVLAITGIINSLFISHLTLKGQVFPAAVEPMNLLPIPQLGAFLHFSPWLPSFSPVVRNL